MTLREAEKLIQERWMTLTEEERFLTCGGMYAADKAILERCAPKHFSPQDVMEFIFYHKHGMTVEESINFVPDKIP
jgi:hypothetical protein